MVQIYAKKELYGIGKNSVAVAGACTHKTTFDEGST